MEEGQGERERERIDIKLNANLHCTPLYNSDYFHKKMKFSPTTLCEKLIDQEAVYI